VGKSSFRRTLLTSLTRLFRTVESFFYTGDQWAPRPLKPFTFLEVYFVFLFSPFSGLISRAPQSFLPLQTTEVKTLSRAYTSSLLYYRCFLTISRSIFPSLSMPSVLPSLLSTWPYSRNAPVLLPMTALSH